MKMRFTPLLLCTFGLLTLPGDAFRAKLKGRPVSQEIGLDPQDMPEPAVDNEKGYLRRLLDYFWEPEEDAVADAFVESVMSEEERAQIRGEPLQKARRSLARGGGSRGGSSRSAGTSSYRASTGTSRGTTGSTSSRGTTGSTSSRGTTGSTSSRGTSSTTSGSRGTSSYANYSGYKGASSPSRGSTAASRSTKTYTTKTTKTTYTYTSRSSYTSSSWGRSTYYGGAYGYGFYGGYYYPPYYPSLYWYTAMRPSWSSSDYCYSCNRMGGNGKVQKTMTQADLAAIDGALDILYSTEWDTQQVCNDSGTGCVANPDHYKALILGKSEGFNSVKNFGQVSAQWRTYTTPRTRTAVYRNAGCYSFKYQPTEQESTTCDLAKTEIDCVNTGVTSPTLDCMWKNKGSPMQVQKNPTGRRRLSERRRLLEPVMETVYDGATPANRYALINSIEYGREEVADPDDGGSMVGAIAGAVVGGIIFCCAIFFLWWCCCHLDGGSDDYHHEHHHEEHQTTTVVETTEVVETHHDNGGGQHTAQQPQGTPSSITINGAGAWQVNGSYNRVGDQNGRPKYIKTDNQMMGIMFDDGSWWIGDVRPSTADYYRHESQPNDPPAYGWGVCEGGGPAKGVEPAPSLQFGYGGDEGVQVYS